MAPNAQTQHQRRRNITTNSKKKTNCNLYMGESEEIKLLTRYVILSMLGKSIEPPFKRAETMKRLVKELEADNNSFFSNVCQQLDLSTTNAYVSFNAVCDEIFTDQINWGRIVSYYTFSVKVAQYFQAQRQDWMEERVILWTHEYLAKLEPWIQEKGRGWVCMHFTD